MSSDILPFYERCASKDGQSVDSEYFRAIGMILPKNSGIQIVYSDYHQVVIQANNQHWRFRQYALPMVEAAALGITALSSEDGAAVRQFNTFRQIQTLNTKNKGPKADLWDKAIYGKEKFEGNE